MLLRDKTMTKLFFPHALVPVALESVLKQNPKASYFETEMAITCSTFIIRVPTGAP